MSYESSTEDREDNHSLTNGNDGNPALNADESKAQVLKRRKRHRAVESFKLNASFFLMMSPGLILIFLLNYLPMAGIFLAFVKYKYFINNFFVNLYYLVRENWVGFANFKIFFKDVNFLYALRNTVLYQLMFIISGIVISLTIALLINELRNRRGAKFYQSCMLLPYFLSWVVFSYIVFAFLSNEHGLINKTLIPAFGGRPISWYMEPKYWPVILLIVNSLKHSGYVSIVYLAAITGIDPEYYEVAVIDGASKWQQATKITIPLMSNVIIIMLILNLGGILSADFGLFYNVPLYSDFILRTTNIVDMWIYRAFRTLSQDSLTKSTAAGLFKSVAGLIMILATNHIVKVIDREKSLF